VLLFVFLVFSAIIGAQDWSNFVCSIATGLEKISVALERVFQLTTDSAQLKLFFLVCTALILWRHVPRYKL